MKKSASKRFVQIDVMKGLAIIGVVLYHYVARGDEAGRTAIATTATSSGADGIVAQLHALASFPIRMQLFMFVAGFLYGRSRLRGGSAAAGYGSFIGTRALRLMVPCVAVGMLDWICRSVVGDLTNPAEIPLYCVPFFAYKRFWFLQALFVLLAVAPLLPRSPRWMGAIVPGLYGLAILVQPSTEFLSLDRVVLLAPFFALGYTGGLLGDTLCTWRARPLTQILLGIAAAVGTYMYLKLRAEGYAATNERLMIAARSIAPTINIAFIWMMAMRYVGDGRAALWRALAATGRESMAVYLYHVPAMMPLKLILSNVSGAPAEAAAGAFITAMGVLVPLALSHYVLSRIPIVSDALLGAPLKRRKERAPKASLRPTAAVLPGSAGLP